MPATEQTYRSQPTLHIVFAISSIAMMLSIVWMILADHLRPWKQVQREFHRVEDAKLEVAERQKYEELQAKNSAAIAEVDRQIEAARAQEQENARAIREKQAEVNRLTGQVDRLDTEKRFQKAELDSQRSFYDGMIDRGDLEEAIRYLNTTIKSSEARLSTLTGEFEAASALLRASNDEITRLRGNVDELVKKREALMREYDRAQRVREQKEAQYFGPLAWLRGLPLIDMAASPVKIQQISLPDLTINYNFKDVPRYDRCTTCHMGIDRIGYDRTAGGEEMPKVFASHPHLTDGASAVDPTGKVVTAGLYLDGNGPHKVNSFGCTICHGGQGSGTDFTFASHTPNTAEEEHRWQKEHGWHDVHFWDEPMLPSRFIESSCLKCHHQVTDVPQAKKLQAGYERITKYGCTGCHTIGGEGSFGPDLTDNRQVGPNLGHIASKVSKDWTLRWIKDPHAFRPDTRMPKFYGVTNNDASADWPKNHAEIHAITQYLWARSTPPTDFASPGEGDLPSQGDAGRGKDLFFQKGCLACHAHKEYGPEGFPEGAGLGVSAREFAKADFGPNLSNMAAKFQSNEQGYRWLANWVHAPEAYHPKSLMPNLQLTWQESADIASWILSVPGEWPEPVDMPAADSAEVREGLDFLVKLFKGKSEPLSQVPEIVGKMSQDEKLLFVGEKTIGRLGCFGCHNIPGFEKYKPIGTPLNGWGIKSPSKLDFAHINEFMVDRPDEDIEEFYEEKLLAHTRTGFLYQKLHRPRSYDYRKTKEDLKAWDERLRMPQFTWADDPKAIEEVMTFVLGLTGEKIAGKYLPRYTPAKAAIAQGERLLNRYNCTGCHNVAMPQYTIAAGTRVDEAMPDFGTTVEVSYRNRANDFLDLYPGLTYDPKKTPELGPDERREVTLEGMPIAGDEGALTVQLWKPVTIRGYTFNVGDNVTVDPTKVRIRPPEGGNFAWLYATAQAEATGTDFATIWNRLPPPLLREGNKVQTDWLTGFLRDPYAIRPAANLRMPRFHYDRTQAETSELANYFAARDGAEFPYQDIPERERAYLAGLEAKHADYLGEGWRTMTKGACIQCHAIGQHKPTGGAQVVNGPDLRQVYDRFRPDYLTKWLARPSRQVPFTAMPQNIPPEGPPPQYVPASFEGKRLAQVKAMRDTLLNYLTAVEKQLAGDGGDPQKAQPPKAAGATE